MTSDTYEVPAVDTYASKSAAIRAAKKPSSEGTPNTNSGNGDRDVRGDQGE